MIAEEYSLTKKNFASRILITFSTVKKKKKNKTFILDIFKGYYVYANPTLNWYFFFPMETE